MVRTIFSLLPFLSHCLSAARARSAATLTEKHAISYVYGLPPPKHAGYNEAAKFMH
jgi:hypothetical protein